MTGASDDERRAWARSLWRYVGDGRPAFAVAPQPGQQSVWDFPRPPRIDADAREVMVLLGDTEIARTSHSLRVCETASPPTWYLPQADVRMALLQPAAGASHCEWKGEARYASVVTPEGRLDAVAWFYPVPLPGYEALRGHVAFYPQRLDCRVDGLRVQPQPGRFYAGWITPDLVGPFKGEPGSEGW
ncbi:DUF427 domain-containing protein [Variovorax sp. dw_954]|uniref:DUF427 domain-containing protein n=1 Tax=Variovorax sp. dw_954 TaxID=2720078 RepID=UPI001BD45CEE|nr:DUF427 domain-containing protein [Variovorax sp. dw_954]